MEPVDEQQDDSEETSTIAVRPESIRIVALVTGAISAILLAASVIVYFTLGAYQPAMIMAGIALIDPLVLQLALGRIAPRAIDLGEVDLDSPFERYFYEKELKEAQDQQIGRWGAPALGAGILLTVAGLAMDALGLSARVLPLFAVWVGAAFVLARYAGSVFDQTGSER